VYESRARVTSLGFVITQKQMHISVIVPVRNEAASIRALLESLLNQTEPPSEIVITDGGSTDATTAIIQEYIDRGAPVRLIRTTMAMPGRGRNLAAERATNEWLAFTDAGIKPAKNWLEALAARANEDPLIDVVYGSYEPVVDSLFKECAAISYVSPPAEFDGSLMRSQSIASAMMRRAAWEKVGGFPEHLRSAEDLLFMTRVEEANFRIAYAPDALVRWELQPNIRRTFKRFLVYARNNIRAGLWRQWQGPVLSRYLMLLLFALPAVFLGLWWLAVPFALWLLLLLARASVAIWRNRQVYAASASRNVLRLLIIVPLIAVLDLGLIVGSGLWLLTDKLGLGRKTAAVGHGT
jgi:glycosyltransferase involved in cell wall biosynthesis